MNVDYVCSMFYFEYNVVEWTCACFYYEETEDWLARLEYTCSVVFLI